MQDGVSSTAGTGTSGAAAGSPHSARSVAPGDGLAIAGLILLHVATWTLYGTVGLGVGILHDDMTEAWNWAQVPELGYFKHPPLFAWITSAWFHVFPVADWSFYLLAAVNAGVALAGIAALARFFGLEAHRRTVLALIIVSPIYGFLALKYNANAVLVPLWPWATYAFLRSLQTRSALHGLTLGLLTGLAVLGKYYSALLGLAFFLVTLLPEYRRAYYRSPAPYVALAAFLATMAPHVGWLFANDFPPFKYAANKFRYSLALILFWAGMTALAPAIFLSLPLALASLPGRCSPIEAARAVGRWLLERRHAALSVIATLPYLITIGLGFFAHAKVSLSYFIPIFFLAPLILVAAIPVARSAAVARFAWWGAIVFMGGIMLAAPVIGYIRSLGKHDLARVPIRELAAEATRIWRAETGRPLAIVASNERFMGALSFYAPDHPLYFIDFDRRRAPWVTDARIAADGMLIVCRPSSALCGGLAQRYSPAGARPETISVARTLRGGRKARPTDYTLIVVPPQPATRR